MSHLPSRQRRSPYREACLDAGWDHARRRAEALLKGCLRILDLHAGADADPVIDAVSDARRGIVCLQVGGTVHKSRPAHRSGKVHRESERRIDRHAEPEVRTELIGRDSSREQSAASAVFDVPAERRARLPSFPARRVAAVREDGRTHPFHSECPAPESSSPDSRTSMTAPRPRQYPQTMCPARMRFAPGYQNRLHSPAQSQSPKARARCPSASSLSNPDVTLM